MQNLTVCLDRRDASGKIQTYQDPLLYRCSTVWRWYSAYDSPHSKLAAVTRIHVFCDCLDFSITDQQLPMLLRLGQLCLLLLYGEVGCNYEEMVASSELEVNNSSNQEQNMSVSQAGGQSDGSNVGWASWAWSFVPEIFPLWEDEEGMDEINAKLLTSCITQFGLFIDKASCVFKLSETLRDTAYYSPPKLSFQPIINLNFYGIATEITKKGEDYANIHMGVTAVILSGIGDCPCNNSDGELLDNENNYFRAGILPSNGHTYNYCTSSLFDPLAPENCNQRREYNFDREDHLTRLTESIMIERFPAFSFDYFYELELPEDWQGSYSDITPLYLEKNNFHERSLCRMVLGPSCLEVSSDMVHRFLKLYHYANIYDYPPYNMNNLDAASKLFSFSDEIVDELEEFVPQRIYHITLIKPLIHIHVANHPYHKLNIKKTSRKHRKKDRLSKIRDIRNVTQNSDQSIIVVISMDSIDFQFSKPMYPYKMAKIVSSLENPSETLLHQCHAHYSLKVFGLEATLAREEKALHTLLLPCSFVLCRKLLLLQSLWSSHQNIHLVNDWIEINNINIQLKHSHLIALLYMCFSWLDSSFTFSHNIVALILQNAFIKDKPTIILQLQNMEFHRAETESSIIGDGSIQKIKLYLKDNDHSVTLLNGPEDTKNIHRASFFQNISCESDVLGNCYDIENKSCIVVSFRWPKSWLNQKTPILLKLQLSGMAGNLDPAIKLWFIDRLALNNVLSMNVKMAEPASIISSPIDESYQDNSISSSHTATPSNSQTASKSHSLPVTNTSKNATLNEILSSDLIERITYFYNILKYILAQIEVESCCILFTSQMWATSSDVYTGNSVLSSWKNAYINDNLSLASILSLPQLKLQNRNVSNAKQTGTLSNKELPAINMEDWNLESTTFSWSIQLYNSSLYSLHKKGSTRYILKPTSAAITLADNTKSALSPSTQLGFCIHVDTEPLHLCLSAIQVQIMVNAMKCMLDCYEQMKINKWMDSLKIHDTFSILTPIESMSKTNLLIDTSLTANTPAEVIDVSTGEKEMNSENASSLTDVSLKGEEKTRITLWLQWTLPKFSTSLFGKENTETYSWLQLEAEEITLSLDIQEIYMKAKGKLSSFNISSFQKSKDNTEWIPGPFRGIVLCSNNKLTHNIHIGSPKHANISSTSSSSNQMCDLQNHAFLLVTYTQALCRNVKKKLTTKYQSHSMGEKQSDIQKLFTNQQSERYVSEIDIQIHPFDIVLWMPLFSVISQIASPLFSLIERQVIPISVNSSKPIGWSTNNHRLPLLYVNAKTIRIFLPRTVSCDVDNYIQTKDISEPSEDRNNISMYSNPDLILFHIGAINMIPQADNPLSRIIIHKELYHAAQQSRTLNIPGSDIEDRQYQLDIFGLAITAVQWKEIILHSNLQNEQNASSVLIMGENPALEWNTRLQCKQDLNEDIEITCIPILSQFDIQVTFAPAIVYELPQQEDGKDLEDILICGHSLELNLINEIDLYLSIQQMALFCDIFENNIGLFLQSLNELENFSKKLKREKQNQKFEVVMDSGIDSECSILQPGIYQIPFFHSGIGILPTTEINQTHVNKFVPFEILITAGSLSITMFGHKSDEFSAVPIKLHSGTKRRLRRRHHQTSDGKDDDITVINFQQKKINQQKEETTSTDSSPLKSVVPKYTKSDIFLFNEEEGYDGSQDSSESDTDIQSKDYFKQPSKLFPFLYITIIQPHAFMTSYPLTQKLEVSCFDVQVKGMASGHYILESENSLIPTPDVFTVPWLETKPGEANAKTGIPPSLYTLTCKDFLHQPAMIHMCFERPIKCNVSPSKYHQVSSFINSIKKYVFKKQNLEVKMEKEENTENNDETDTGANIKKFREFISHLKSFEISTVQTVFVIDLGQKSQDLQLTLSIENIHGILDKVPKTQTEIFKIEFISLLLKTAYNGHTCPLIGPFTTKLQLTTIWKIWHLCSPLPQLLLHLQGDAVVLTFGPKQLESLLALQNVLQQFINNTENDSQESTNKNKSTELTRIEWNDDLRKGSFQYIQDTEGIGLDPQPQEIVFCKEQSGEQSTMTWCYPEPRTLTSVTVYPVPLHPSSNNSEIEESIEKVECSLQYWDKLQNCFINYCNFQLSETSQYNLDLPVICSDSSHIAIVSEIWRIVLFNTEEDTKIEILSSGALSPLVLAACLRVDSCFDPALIPVLSASMNFDLIQISIYNHFKKIAPSLNLHPFSFDGQAPLDQEFLLISVDGLSLNYKKWYQQLKVDVLMNIGCEILEYKCLTMQTMFEPFDIQGHLYVNMETDKPPIYEIKVTIHPCFIQISQSIIHTLNIGIDSWLQVLNKSSEIKQILPNYYIICNNTQQTIYVGQIDTDEAIMLPSQKMHAYSWKSHNNKKQIHVCLENMKWKWCEAFSIDSSMTLIQTVKNKEYSITLIIKIVSLSNVQKQIIINGQLMISNKLNQNLEVQLQTINPFLPVRDWTGHKLTLGLNKQSILPSFIFSKNQIGAFRVRLMGLDTPWSESVTITKNKVPNQLIKLPMKDSSHYLSFWCHILDQQITQKISSTLILFSPVFMVRNHLPHPLLAHLDNHISHCVEISGQGEEHQLLTIGDANLCYSLSFQMAPGMKMSAPAISLSSSLIDEIKETSSDIDYSLLYNHTTSIQSLCWPYDNAEITSEIKELFKNNSTLPNIPKPNHFSCISKPSELPDIELQVGLSQQWPGCNTILIDVKPYGLLINKTNIDLYMLDDNGQEWKINRYSIFTPPSLQKSFQIGVQHQGKSFFSKSLRISDQDRLYWSKMEDVLPLFGYATIPIEVVDNKISKICLLLVSSLKEEGINIVTIQPTIYITNNSNKDLHMISYISLTSLQKMSNCQKPMKIKSTSDNCSVQPLLFWEISDVSLFRENDNKLSHYFEFYHSTNQETDEYIKNFEYWSYPVCIQQNMKFDRRYTFSIPEPEKLYTKPYVMTCHEKKGVKYLVITHDSCPLFMFHNNTQYSLTFEHVYARSNKEGDILSEDTESHQRILILSPHNSMHYTLPAISQKFPDYVEHIPAMHFSLYVDEHTEKIWSIPVDIARINDQFVNIPSCGDVRIYKEEVGHTRHIFIDPVNRVEVSAKEIRSRIGLNTQVMLNSDAFTKIENEIEISNGRKSNQVTIDSQTENNINDTRNIYYLSFSATHICFVLKDDFNEENPKEILRLSLDNILSMAQPPSIKPRDSVLKYNHCMQEINVFIGKIQIDNQMNSTGIKGYDFPVVMIPQNCLSYSEIYQIKESSFQTRWSKMKETAHVVVYLFLQKTCDNGSATVAIKNLSITLRPSLIYLEDSLYYKLAELQSSFLSYNSKMKLPEWNNDLQLPLDIKIINKTFSHPVHIQHLHIDAINILLSLHASVKLYVAIDHSPLSFKPFDKDEIFTTTFKLGHIITHHFLTGALLRAGWVVGSLDLLGNPAGFARAVSNGMADFFRLPYHGLLQGPWAFIGGISHGSASLLQQITSGALVSVTNLAASISRNMDFLSMDADHLSRQEELRRQKPVGISMGILQGLTGFGISLLEKTIDFMSRMVSRSK
ncbi:vacuolar protein sorting-associated protein 13B-like isoform X2 [Centruroides sculpturatus]|uniref:vacuolar protein sorting-associated protein 13B-like isoform X2 n=1 Tax=Centruroides sculpturatus TaxID=218467 RepID=UPI000C6C8951|nr:vacuolar protein sorting-associated protein 13B-like isoform X2 [Centruroides sculpturatus]